MLHYEKLDVYKVSIQFVAAALAISDEVPKGYAALADQLRRAAWSIPLNIAEGVGKPSPADQARFHAIARGSAMECGAILDVVNVLHVGTAQELASAKGLIVRVVEMLTRMCRQGTAL
jgi:four helix bundle protein